MGYNPYRWYSKGKKHKTLPESRPLLLRIRNGDFGLSHYLKQIPRVKREYEDKYQEAWDSYPGGDQFERHQHSHRTARMRNVARLKLEEEGMFDEIQIFQKLRDSLKDEFGEDCWDEATSPEIGLETIEDIYWYYKEKTGMGQTPSEIAIQLGRNNVRGLL